MEVRNLTGTSGLTCACGSWITHWINFSGTKPEYCSAKGCKNEEVVGTHVRKCNRPDKSNYIVPFCVKHNKSKLIIQLEYGTALVSANTSETCADNYEYDDDE